MDRGMSSPLGKSLQKLGYDDGDILDVLSEHAGSLEKGIDQVEAKAAAKIIGALDSLANPSDEPKDTILESKVRAIFSYGTLRADFSEEGDKWGVVREGNGCIWKHAVVRGYDLFQDPHLTYPFATPSRDPNTKLKGTLLTWASENTFVEKLQQCNQIEGFDPSSDNGLYLRAVVQAVPTETKANDSEVIEAYIYYQDKNPEDLTNCWTFPNGDWLKPEDRTKLTSAKKNS